MTIQDQYTSQYTSAVRQTQETWADLIESFTTGLQKNIGQPFAPFSFAPVSFGDPTAAIDQVFDFWEKTLEVQRDLAKKLTHATLSVGETVQSQVESVKESVKEAVHEHAVESYAGLTKVELQDELVSRDLPKTGNVDDLRERLIEDDKK